MTVFSCLSFGNNGGLRLCVMICDPGRSRFEDQLDGVDRGAASKPVVGKSIAEYSAASWGVNCRPHISSQRGCRVGADAGRIRERRCIIEFITSTLIVCDSAQ